MTRLCTVSLLFSFLIVFTGGAVFGETEGKVGPVMEFDNKDFDAGPVRAGEVTMVTHVFTYKNVGDEDLELIKIRPSCGCTAADPDKHTLKPGEEGHMEVALNTKGRSGVQHIRVRIDTNQVENPKEEIHLRATLLTPWKLRPTQLDMGGIVKNSKMERDVRIISQVMGEEKPGKVLGVQSHCEQVSAVLGETPEVLGGPAGDYQEVSLPLSVTVNSGNELGEYKCELLVQTDDPDEPTLTLTVNWVVEGDISFIPSKLFLSQVKQRNIPRKLIVESRAGIAFNITDVAVLPEDMSNAIKVIKDSEQTDTRKTYQVMIDPDTDMNRENWEGEVVITTDSKEVPELVIPYRAVIRK